MKLGTGKHRVEVPGTPHPRPHPVAAWGQQSPRGLCRRLGGGPLASPVQSPNLHPLTKKVTNAGSQLGTEAESPDPLMTRAMAGHPLPSTKSQGVERGIYCVQRPIVQSKDCTDTGGVRESQRPEPGGRRGGRRGGMLAPPPDQ